MCAAVGAGNLPASGALPALALDAIRLRVKFISTLRVAGWALDFSPLIDSFALWPHFCYNFCNCCWCLCCSGYYLLTMSVSDGAALASSDEEAMPVSSHPNAHRDYSDSRLERVANYTTTTMRLKPDKWAKMMANDDFRVSLHLHSHFPCHFHAIFHAMPTTFVLTVFVPDSDPNSSALCWTGCMDEVVYWSWLSVRVVISCLAAVWVTCIATICCKATFHVPLLLSQAMLLLLLLLVLQHLLRQPWWLLQPQRLRCWCQCHQLPRALQHWMECRVASVPTSYATIWPCHWQLTTFRVPYSMVTFLFTVKSKQCRCCSMKCCSHCWNRPKDNGQRQYERIYRVASRKFAIL